VADTGYALSAVNKGGRVADRSIVRVLGWVPGTRLDIREQAGIIVARATGSPMWGGWWCPLFRLVRRLSFGS
jgi:hypothetical protein